MFTGANDFTARDSSFHAESITLRTSTADLVSSFIFANETLVNSVLGIDILYDAPIQELHLILKTTTVVAASLVLGNSISLTSQIG